MLDVDGRMVDMPQQTTAITDSSTLAALLGSDAYRQASGTAESSESASDGASDVTFTLQWLLKTPIDVWSLPPTAFYAQHDEQACVVSDGKPVAAKHASQASSSPPGQLDCFGCQLQPERSHST